MEKSNLFLSKKSKKFEYALLPILSKCNYNCIFCTSDYPGKEKKIRKNKSREELLKIKKLLIIGRSLQIKKLFLGGDEPLTHPFILPILNISQKLGYREVSLYTSGLKLTEKYIAKSILSMPLRFNLYIPIYGANAEVHDMIVRRKGTFNILINALNNLKRLKSLNVALHSIALKQNYHFLDDILEFCKRNFGDFTFDGFLHVKFFPYPKESDYKNLMPPYSKLLSEAKISKKFLRGFPICILQKFGKIKNINTEIPSYILLNKGILHLGRYPQSLYEEERNIQNPAIKKCLGCKKIDTCIRPYRSYIDNFGNREFSPFK